MVTGVWGKKIGMTQVFSGDIVVPVTVVDVSNWFITGLRTLERNGYTAVQVGHPRDKYAKQPFEKEWLIKPKKHFRLVREIRVNELPEGLEIGNALNPYDVVAEGDTVDVVGITRGRGFAGVVKRHNFSGAPASHGHTMGARHPGSLGGARKQGKVHKGKKMAGHMGVRRRMIKSLQVVKVEKDAHIMLVKGAIPGHAGSLVFLRKA